MEIDEIDSPEAPDFRRANGAPMVMVDGKNVRLSRPSSWGKVLDDESALVNWKLDRAIQGVAGDPALQAKIVAAKPDDRKTFQGLREQAINAGRGDQAADIGTALHAMSVRFEDPEDDFDPPEPYKARLVQYGEVLAQYGLVSELFEYAVVSLKWGAAGTADRLYRLTTPLVAPSGEILPAGTMVIGDLKTGRSLEYSIPGYAVQMAIYSDGQRYDVVNDEFMDTPETNRDWGLIVHLPADGDTCDLIWVDLGTGELGASIVKQVKEWRKSWRGATEYGAFAAVPPMSVEAVADALDAELVVDTAELAEFVSKRLSNLKAKAPDEFARLLKLWPEGVPTKKAELTNPDHVEQLMNLLDKFEAEAGLGWVEGDPRTRPGVHSRNTNLSNNPKEMSNANQ